MKKMPRMAVLAGILALAAGLAVGAPAKSKSTSDKWLHVRVEDGSGEDQERVRVLAEAVIPAIDVENLRNGKVKIEMDGEDGPIKNVDLRKILQALRDTKDGNFVTVEGSKDQVQVAKQNGYLIAKVREGKSGGTRVDAKLPFAVVEALLSGDKDELDLAAGIRALGEHGDGVLVTVDDNDSRVRIWVDSRNESE